MMSTRDVSILRNQLTSLSRRLRQESRNTPQSWAKMLILSAIDRLGDGVTPSELANAEQMQSSNLAPLLRVLEDELFIQRLPDNQDRRKVRITLLPAGKAALADNRRLRDEWLSEAIHQQLTPAEQDILFKAGEIAARLAAVK
ncbi:hypothetical protein QU24_23290 [Pantoea rodasii]|uniref:HTH marR-type domain-containing protein n=1 Tax=Pantoea rodasii TaxID=1076549 RepID=A0A0B1QY58_9GAMM|nr:MarR family transcriptional regulator [Pantoea rodasii]KHJ65693.1 hypothetical protein QU24_23290 [Pantoea rodasii]